MICRDTLKIFWYDLKREVTAYGQFIVLKIFTDETLLKCTFRTFD